jgi:hypothetical protein
MPPCIAAGPPIATFTRPLSGRLRSHSQTNSRSRGKTLASSSNKPGQLRRSQGIRPSSSALPSTIGETASGAPSRHSLASGSPRDAAVAGQRIWHRAVGEPAQPQHRLPEAGQRLAAFRCPAPPPLGRQQPGNEPDQFPGHIKGGTLGDHVEASSGSRSLARPLLLGLHAHPWPARFIRVSAQVPPSGHEKAQLPNLFR